MRLRLPPAASAPVPGRPETAAVLVGLAASPAADDPAVSAALGAVSQVEGVPAVSPTAAVPAAAEPAEDKPK